MKEIRLHEGELNVMELLWSNKELAAKDISKIIKEYIGWEKNTTKKKIQDIETKALLDKLYSGSLSNLITDYLAYQKLSGTDISNLERIISNQRM